VLINANSRFTLKSWKSQITDSENPGPRENGAQPKEQDKTQLRKKSHAPSKARAKLDVTYLSHLSQTFSFFKTQALANDIIYQFCSLLTESGTVEVRGLVA